MATNHTDLVDRSAIDPARTRVPGNTLATWTVRLAAAVVGLAGAAGVIFGATIVLEDASQHGEMFDGLGIFLGLVVCGLGALLATGAGLTAWLAGRHPFEAALTMCALGVLVAASGWLIVGGMGVLVSATMVLGGVFVAALGLGAALGARR